MLPILEQNEYEKVRGLVSQAAHVLAVEAVLDGVCPGKVWVDDPGDPRAALVDTPEGHYVIGAPGEGFSERLGEFIADTLAPGGRGECWWWFYLRCASPAWAEALRLVLPAERTVEEPREFYVCEQVIHQAPEAPAGFELVQVDKSFLERDELADIDFVRRWARNNFGSYEGFLRRGFAFCLVHADEIVSVCCADNASGRRCEVGVRTARDYRLRGFGALTVAAAVRWALSNGFEQVGWHCLKFNLGSSATARKVGFRKSLDYSAFEICARPADAHLVRGNQCLLLREFGEAAAWYERGLQAARVEGEPVSYLLAQEGAGTRYAFQAACAHALAGEHGAGLEMLEAAIEAAGYRQGGY